MESVKGLKELIASENYRKALGLPANVVESYYFLAQGEYNRNYIFTHPTSGEKLVLRVNFGSQMHLDNQICYESRALELLKDSGRTPRVLYTDDSKTCLDQGVLVMTYLPGRPLIYRKDDQKAMETLADIHALEIGDDTHLLAPSDPLRAMLEECEAMAAVYFESPLSKKEVRDRLRRQIDSGWKRYEKMNHGNIRRCLINTELNSTNFLVEEKSGRCSLVDWEKPLYADPAQDIGHYIAPTTTFWKSDVIFDRREMDEIIDFYLKAANGRFVTDGMRERIYDYMTITLLRGLSWCAMAWTEYQNPERALSNASTRRKLDAYLEREWL